MINGDRPSVATIHAWLELSVGRGTVGAPRQMKPSRRHPRPLRLCAVKLTQRVPAIRLLLSYSISIFLSTPDNEQMSRVYGLARYE